MGRKHTGYCLNFRSTFGAIIFSCAVQGYLSSTLKQKLHQESDFQQNGEAFKNWQSLTAILPSQQTPHAKDSVYSTPTAKFQGSALKHITGLDHTLSLNG